MSGGRHACDVDNVLDGDRQSMEGAARLARCKLPVTSLGFDQRCLGLHSEKGVQLGIEGVNPPQAGFDDVARGERAGTHSCCEWGKTQLGKRVHQGLLRVSEKATAASSVRSEEHTSEI